MVEIAHEGESLLIRTYFGDQGSWDDIVAAASKSHTQSDGTEVRATLTLIDDTSFESASPAEVISLLQAPPPTYAFIADRQTFESSEMPILAIDIRNSGGSEPMPAFRVMPAVLADVENNLSIANLDFADYQNAADSDGIFRGFGSPQTTTRIVTKQRLLEAAADGNLTETILARYRSDLEKESRSEWEAKLAPDLRATHEYYASGRDNYWMFEEVLGLDETIDATRDGGSALVFGLPISYGRWGVYLDPDTLAPITALMTRMPTPEQQQASK
ncbi:hypothetical protein [Rhodococcus sp. 1168]|uniref:DUF6924 domain-containing protein n=1 Tax=Rhodococcus sp. 1168 TaxID=2018041 RepID=UPI000A0B42F6|nr:hypothetical protein [Rhodococcus sp. 1168]ORI21643.1 hypothetical protein BJI47_11180 [Rhodococcus sp. 1168]